ncbi:MAG: radical SAM protein [Desulfomonile tiedjei]|uniref:Radical SAM protein n=1 Tax=Desulfomonile tiedjei TaxID=2358 RepID=A0A9D6Z8A0_9BACT|nr:radical SAM protein [Desulfomonile tiedjei]
MQSSLKSEHQQLLDEAWNLSRARHGCSLSVHIPGMFVVNGRRGRYRAISITGDKCDLACEHCKGTLLRTMPNAPTPDSLVERGKEAVERGDYGILITGGCDSTGRLPWKEFIPAIKRLKTETDLIVTVHAGQVDLDAALALKGAGVDQALVDVIGDDSTASQVYHLDNGVSAIAKTMDSLALAGLEIIPHILFGLHYGQMKGEIRALQMLKNYDLKKYVLVVIMPASGTPMAGIEPPAPLEAALFLARARMELPSLEASLGCARPRGKYRRELDVLAVAAGVNSLALPSEQGLKEAEERKLRIIYSETCCSLGGSFAGGDPT